MKTLKLISIAYFFFISTIIFSQEYRVYVSSGTGGFSSVKEFTLQGDYLGDFVSLGSGGLDWPQDIIFLEDQEIMLVSGLNSQAIHQYNSITGADEGIWANIPGKPTRMKIGPDGYLYVLQWDTNSKVLRFELDGTPLGEFTNTGVTQSIGLEWDSSGNLYVSSYGLGVVQKFNTLGQDQGVFISGLSGPTDIWRDSNSSGDFLINQWNGNKVRRYDSNGNFIGDFIPSIIQPEGHAYLPNGNLLIGSAGTADKIIEYQSNGTLVGDFATGNGLANPNAIVVRDATFSTKDFKKNKVLVAPTMGSTFKLNTTETHSLKSLEVVSLLGQKVADIDLMQETWEASSLKEGMYFLVAKDKGVMYTQKIIVKK
ncbi:MAG: T9SS type A sorting domain-containing protein [Flavobacteriaceae bacterium]|nr:T9SS type A sorting domain-containing protein [Flavobacteriaceae bacterium]